MSLSNDEIIPYDKIMDTVQSDLFIKELIDNNYIKFNKQSDVIWLVEIIGTLHLISISMLNICGSDLSIILKKHNKYLLGSAENSYPLDPTILIGYIKDSVSFIRKVTTIDFSSTAGSSSTSYYSSTFEDVERHYIQYVYDSELGDILEIHDGAFNFTYKGNQYIIPVWIVHELIKHGSTMTFLKKFVVEYGVTKFLELPGVSRSTGNACS